MNQKRTAYWNIGWVIIPLFLYYFVSNIVVLLGMGILQSQSEVWAENSVLQVYLTTAVKMTGMFLGGVVVYPLYKKEISALSCEDKAEKYGKKEMMGSVVLGAAWGIGLNYLFSLTGFVQSSEKYEQVAQSQFGVPVWLAIVFYGVLSPFVEEMLFRGLMYNVLKRNIGYFPAVLASALLFGVFHGNIVQMAYGSLMGMMLALYYEKYGKLAAPVLFHSAANTVVYVISYYF